VVALNKSDLPACEIEELRLEDRTAPVVQVSALSGSGLDELRAAILRPFSSVDRNGDGLLVTNARHHDLLQRSAAELRSSRALVREGASEELTLVGLHNALRMLDEITGETTTEDILSKIFSTFCIGK
jgi:tRNA modification GTPase